MLEGRNVTITTPDGTNPVENETVGGPGFGKYKVGTRVGSKMSANYCTVEISVWREENVNSKEEIPVKHWEQVEDLKKMLDSMVDYYTDTLVRTINNADRVGG